MKKVKEIVLSALEKYWAGLKTKVVLKSNIINNLTSTSTDAPLSASQGKVLKGEVDSLNEKLGNIRYIRRSTFEAVWNDATGEDFYIIDVTGYSDAPSELMSNRYLGYQWRNNQKSYGFQVAFTFAANKIAMRRIQADVWSDWAYFVDQSYIDDKMRIVESEEVSFRPSTTIQFTNYTVTVPSGYSEVSREFYRTDSGGYQVLVSTFYARNYITYLSSADIGTVKGKVKVLCIKN